MRYSATNVQMDSSSRRRLRDGRGLKVHGRGSWSNSTNTTRISTVQNRGRKYADGFMSVEKAAVRHGSECPSPRNLWGIRGR